MPIPRRLVMIAVGAVGAGVVMYLRNRQLEQKQKERDREEGFKQRETPPPAEQPPADAPPAAAPSPAPAASSAGATKELAAFLAGESWYDELGWQGIWEREGIDAPEGWLKTKGKDVLAAERKKLVEHPALLAGCRRRWIVVCRYAGIDVTDAAATWNQVAD